MPRHGKLLLFTAQTLFAVGDYRSAAAAIHQATSQLGSEQWGYVVENARQYYRGHAFVDQMDRLNEYIKKNPDAGYAYFLRGYQHGFLGHLQTAVRDLNKAVELESRDKLAARLIERFGGTPPATADQPILELNPAADPAPNSTMLDEKPAIEERAERSLESTKTIEPVDKRDNSSLTHDH